MAKAMKQMNEWEQKYYDVTELFALSDDLLKTVETAADPEAQLALVEPLIEAIGEGADVLTDEYIALCEGKKERKGTAKSRIELSLRKIYVAMHECSERARDVKNAVHAVIKRIKRQLEQVIVNFLEFVTVSLDRMMQKQDVEEMKQRHAHIALMLHQAAQGA
jgi:hypothetical protein